MCIKRIVVFTMIQNEQKPIAFQPISVYDGPFIDGANVVPLAGTDFDAFTVDIGIKARVFLLAEGCDDAPPAGPGKPALFARKTPQNRSIFFPLALQIFDQRPETARRVFQF